MLAFPGFLNALFPLVRRRLRDPSLVHLHWEPAFLRLPLLLLKCLSPWNWHSGIEWLSSSSSFPVSMSFITFLLQISPLPLPLLPWCSTPPCCCHSHHLHFFPLNLYTSVELFRSWKFIFLFIITSSFTPRASVVKQSQVTQGFQFLKLLVFYSICQALTPSFTPSPNFQPLMTKLSPRSSAPSELGIPLVHSFIPHVSDLPPLYFLLSSTVVTGQWWRKFPIFVHFFSC